MQVQDALLFLVDCLRTNGLRGCTNYGYDLYLPPAIHKYLCTEGQNVTWGDSQMVTVSPVFMDAAWELCRRGVLRPGVREWQQQETRTGTAGLGFSVTPFGRTWLAEADLDVFVPTEPESFAKLLAPYTTRFGIGFKQRSQEAIRCYGSHAYLACCTMCGAAAESVLLAVAVAKTGDEAHVLKMYCAAQGRSRVEKLVVGQAPEPIRRNIEGLSSLLKYWRDVTAHGMAAEVEDIEAYTSLALLLRYSQYVHESWNDLTGAPQ